MGQATETVQPFEIAGESIAPGERRTLAIPVSRQLTGLSASLALQVLHGARPGPCVFVSAAVHGDEINGLAIVQRLCAELDPAAMAGTLILAPAVNIYGLVAHERYLPDRRDLNRSFPGSARGSLAAQLANCMLEHVIDKCSLGIDLHTAAVHRYNLPQIRIAADNPYLVELAMAFGAPVIIESPLARWLDARAGAHPRHPDAAAGGGRGAALRPPLDRHRRRRGHARARAYRHDRGGRRADFGRASPRAPTIQAGSGRRAAASPTASARAATLSTRAMSWPRSRDCSAKTRWKCSAPSTAS